MSKREQKHAISMLQSQALHQDMFMITGGRIGKPWWQDMGMMC